MAGESGDMHEAARLHRAQCVGIIDDAPIWNHFREALRASGYLDGQTIAYEYRIAEGKPEQWVPRYRCRCYENFPQARSVAHQMTQPPGRMTSPSASQP